MKCGTFGCILNDRHLGLHMFAPPPRRLRYAPVAPSVDVVDGELFVCSAAPVKSSIEDAALGKTVWVEWLTSNKKRKWYKGHVDKYRMTRRGAELFVKYCDGDESWELAETCIFERRA